MYLIVATVNQKIAGHGIGYFVNFKKLQARNLPVQFFIINPTCITICIENSRYSSHVLLYTIWFACITTAN